MFFRNHTDYDFIVSRAVLEHVDDPGLSLRLMAQALKPGGMMLHKVDLTDHGMFTPEHGDLTFLRFPDWYYSLMAKGSGRPNRVLIDQYRSIMESTGLVYHLLVTKLVGGRTIVPHTEWDDIDQGVRTQALSEVCSVRTTLAKDFQMKEDRDLAVSGVFIVARKTV